MGDVGKKGRYLAWWQWILIAILCLSLLAWAAMHFTSNAKLHPITVNPQGLSKAEVTAIENVVAPLGQVQFLSADLANIHQEVAKLSWVENVSVARVWNQGVEVKAVPRVAIAKYGSEQMLDANGVAFTPVSPEAYTNMNLAYLHARSEESELVMKQMQKINTWFAPVKLYAKDLILTPRRTWVVIFNNNMRVIVDYEDTEQKLYNLSVQLAGALNRDVSKIQAVDLRYKNGFAVTYKKQN